MPCALVPLVAKTRDGAQCPNDGAIPEPHQIGIPIWVDAVTQYGNPLNSVRLYWAVWTYNKVQVSRGGFGTAYRMGVFNIL